MGADYAAQNASFILLLIMIIMIGYFLWRGSQQRDERQFNAQLNASIRLLEAQNARFTTEMMKAQSDVDRLQAGITDMETAYTAMAEQVEVLRVENERLHDQIKRLEGENHELRYKLSQRDEKIESMQHEIEALQKANENRMETDTKES
jgi:chromosome segregation ATPase